MRAPRNPHLRAAIEIAFIVFLFYSNLLMGEFTVAAGHGKTFPAALADVITFKTFTIALVTAIVGHLGFDTLRKNT